MMAIYDLLAPYYDAATGDSATEAAFIHDIIERRHSQAATLLDLACGTGSITALLAGLYEVSGLDISPGMLAIAREKVRSGTELYLADMTNFSLAARFDVIVCAYKGINHLLSLAAWKIAFDRACEHLSRGGLFIFDIATLSHLQGMASIPQVVAEFAGNYLLIRVRTADGIRRTRTVSGSCAASLHDLPQKGGEPGPASTQPQDRLIDGLAVTRCCGRCGLAGCVIGRRCRRPMTSAPSDAHCEMALTSRPGCSVLGYSEPGASGP